VNRIKNYVVVEGREVSRLSMGGGGGQYQSKWEKVSLAAICGLQQRYSRIDCLRNGD